MYPGGVMARSRLRRGMGIVYGEKRESAALYRLEAEFGIDTEGDKGWITWVTLVPSSTVLMYLWLLVPDGLVFGAVGGLVAVVLDVPLLLSIGAVALFAVGLEYLATKRLIPRWNAFWETRPAFLAINDERVVIARISPYRWSVRHVLVDESPRVGGFQYSDHHTPTRIGLAFVRPSSPPLYCQINNKAREFTADLTTRFGQPLRPDTSE